MTEREVFALKHGDRVRVNYHGEWMDAVVISTVDGDRFKRTVVVEFASGAVWSPAHSDLIRRANG